MPSRKWIEIMHAKLVFFRETLSLSFETRHVKSLGSEYNVLVVMKVNAPKCWVWFHFESEMNLQRGQAILDCSLIIRSVFMRVIDTCTHSQQRPKYRAGEIQKMASVFSSQNFFSFMMGTSVYCRSDNFGHVHMRFWYLLREIFTNDRLRPC